MSVLLNGYLGIPIMPAILSPRRLKGPKQTHNLRVQLFFFNMASKLQGNQYSLLRAVF